MRISAAALFLFFAPFLAATPLYVVTDLGSLGGSGSTAYAINNQGLAVGSARLPSESNNAFVSPGGSMSALNAANATSSQANGINNAGQVAGTVYTTAGAQATIWNAGLFSNLGTLGGTDSYAMAINDAGSVAGSASLKSGDAHAYLYDKGQMNDLGTLANGTWSSAYGVNSSNHVTGYSTTADGNFRAFVWDDGKGMSDIGSLGGNSYGMAINDEGDVVGASVAPSGYMHGFVWTGGVMQDLGTLGGSSSYAYGINSWGQVVGYSYIPESENTHAFLWMGDGLLDLNSLLPKDSGVVLNEAYAINDNGQIVGRGTYKGQSRAFRLDPQLFQIAIEAFTEQIDAGPVDPLIVPEPGSLSMLGMGAVLLAAGSKAFRKRQA